MVRVSAEMFAGDYLGAYRQTQRLAARRMEAAALIATDTAARKGLTALRDRMKSARLGRLGGGLGSTSDMQRGGKVHRTAYCFSASGVVYIRSRSPRTRGAIEAYTQGAAIRPVRGRWLWIATDEIPRVTGRVRMTPELYRKNGFEAKIGPLTFIRSVNGNPLLVARNVGVSAAGKSRSARSLRKNGLPRQGQIRKEFIVAFVGIPRTDRKARVNVKQTLRQVQGELPHLFAQALQRTF